MTPSNGNARAVLGALIATLAGCGEPALTMDAGPPPLDASAMDDAGARDGGASDAAMIDGGAAPSVDLPRRHVFDPDRAARGRDAIATVPGARVPLQALRSLWVVWGQPGLGEDAYWSEFARRYGFVPRDGAVYPYGVVVDGEDADIQCLACHVDRVAGEAVIGAGNGRLRLEALYDDLIRLADIASAMGIPVPPIPDVWRDAYEGRTGAPGATDAFGMGMTLAAAYAPTAEVETRYGFQQPPAWWQLPYKDRVYTDGVGPNGNHRLMLATVLASGASVAELMAMDETFEDIRHYLLSLSAPAWPFDPPLESDVAAGRAIFERECASCHGVHHGPEASYPDLVVDVGTDAIRHARFTAVEASWLNAGWFGDPPLMDTDGYLAPPLVGVWASAPYLHNGSVPTLRALLRPDERPTRFARVSDDDDYDPVAVGVRTEPASAGAETAYDTAIEGLSAAGHTRGEALTDDEVHALLAYLVTL